jgi:hypothetical protein
MSETKVSYPITRITCCDCGTVITVMGAEKPKEIAKTNKWKHAGTGKWRCELCDTLNGTGNMSGEDCDMICADYTPVQGGRISHNQQNHKGRLCNRHCIVRKCRSCG